MEPDYLAQTAEPMDDTERRAWIRARADDAHAAGAVQCRVSMHPDIPNLLLMEGWNERPDSEGEPRWQFAAKQVA